MKKRCSNCEKWEPTKGDFGFCKANAPNPAILQAEEKDNFVLVWPSTGADDWCEGFEYPTLPEMSDKNEYHN